MFPVGTKLLWLNKRIPTGWRIEATGTADSMIKVLASATNAGEINAGYNPFDLKAADLPSHTHGLTVNDAGNHAHANNYTSYSDHGHGTRGTNAAGNHKHGVWTGAAGNHAHTYQVSQRHVGYTGSICCALATPLGNANTGVAGNHAHAADMHYAGNHAHTVYIGAGTGGNHRHGPFNTTTTGNHAHSGSVHASATNNKKPKSINACIIVRVS
jgi:hypothetical protein